MDQVSNQLLLFYSYYAKGEGDGEKKHRRSGLTFWQNLSGEADPDNGDDNKPSLPAQLYSLLSLGLTKALLTDKLFERFLSMALPVLGTTPQATALLMLRVEMQRTRPLLLVNTMLRHVIAMNQRLLLPFELIDEIIKVFLWLLWLYTGAIMLVYTLVVLNPVWIAALFPGLLVACVIVPNYLAMHPPENLQQLFLLAMQNPFPALGPSLRALPELPKPAPEISREFILNVTDLQNHMLLYVALYDVVAKVCGGCLYFADESVTDAVTCVLAATTLFNLWMLPLVVRHFGHVLAPVVQLLCVVAGWLLAVACHPHYRERVLGWYYREETRLWMVTLSARAEKLVSAEFNIDEDDLFEPQEQREVEVFEMHRFNLSLHQWVAVGYTTDVYTTNLALRGAQKKPACVSDLDLVQPPVGWEFIDNGKWKVDLEPTAWVEGQILESVTHVDDDEKWVYDADQTGYRRRRWVRICLRAMLDKAKEKSEAYSGELVEEQFY